MIPGEYILDEKAGSIEANAGRRTIRLLVRNTGDRPVQIGTDASAASALSEFLLNRLPKDLVLRLDIGREARDHFTIAGDQELLEIP